jgi:flagellar biosynthesis protein FliQ
MSITFSVIAGLLVPFAVSFLKSRSWSSKVNQLVAVVVSLVVGAGISIFDNGLDITNWTDFAANFGVIFTVANIWYNQYFANTHVNEFLEEHGVGSHELSWDEAESEDV